MTKTTVSPILQMIRRIAEDQRIKNLPDQELLRRFTGANDDAAFACLLRRHGCMVLDVCRSVVGNDADAEDAFQATFLILAKKARSIRNLTSVGSWLYGVAYRTALKAQAAFASRQKHELRTPAQDQAPADELTWSEIRQIIHAELTAIAERYRAPLVLCFLEGKTQDEAAKHLGVSKSTVKRRLERGRAALRLRLVRRGLGPTALVMASAWPAATAKACVSPALVSGTVKAASAVALGQTTMGLLTGHVAYLLENGLHAMLLSKLKVATAVVMAFALLSVLGGWVIGIQAAIEPGADQTGSAAPGAQSNQPGGRVLKVANPRNTQPSKGDGVQNAITFTGRVLDPDKKPVAGAKVYYHFITHDDEAMPVRATTDSQGRFSFILTPQDVPLSAAISELTYPFKTGQIVVKAEGYSITWRLAGKQVADLSLQLGKDDTPIEGRILNLEGKPLAGLRVSVLSAAASENGDISGVVKDLQSGESFYAVYFKHFPNYLATPVTGRSMARFLPSAVTDSNGRFRLHGFAKEQLVELRIEGDSIETQQMYVLTNSKPSGVESLFALPPRAQEQMDYGTRERKLVLWNGFDHAAPPGQIVTGTVRDEATKMPIPGAIVESYLRSGSDLGQNDVDRTVTDGNGRFRLTGFPRGQGNEIRVRSPKDLPYVPVVKKVPTWKASSATALDVSLQRGVWVDVMIKDKSTGKPVTGNVSYFVLPEDAPKDPGSDRPFAQAYGDFMPNLSDGTFRFPAVIRRAIIAFRTNGEKYPIPLEAATIKLPSILAPSNFQAFAEIAPKASDKAIKVELILDKGEVAKGKIIGPDGQPIAGALVTGLHEGWSGDSHGPLRTSEFTAIGLKPNQPRLLCFSHEAMKLAGSVVVRSDDKSGAIVKLAPWATVSGRLLDGEGKPIQNAALYFTEVPRKKQGTPLALDTGIHVVGRFAGKPSRDPRTDDDGRFLAEGLVPGLKYNLALFNDDAIGRDDEWPGLAFTNLVLEPGETKNLGDVKLRSVPKGPDR